MLALRTRSRLTGQILRGMLIRGTKLLLPLAVLFVVMNFVFAQVDAMLGGVTAAFVRLVVPDRFLGPFGDGHVPGMSMVLLILFVLAVGFAASWKVSDREIKAVLDLVIIKIPVLGQIYKTVSQMMDTLGHAGVFQRVVLVPIFKGYATGLVSKEVTNIRTGEKLLWVYIPWGTNPAGGISFMMPERETVPTDLTVEEALQRTMTWGLLMPDTIDLERSLTPPAVQCCHVQGGG